MTTQQIRTALSSVGVGLLATTAIAFLPSLAAVPASAGDDRPACTKENPGGNSDKKCPSPSPTESTPTGTETGCRDLTFGTGQFRGVDGVPDAGSMLVFILVVGGDETVPPPTCPEVTYTVIARDPDTLAELSRQSQLGNGVTSALTTVFALPTFNKDCIAVDVVISEGAVIHDFAPNSRDTSQRACDLNRNGSGPQTWN